MRAKEAQRRSLLFPSITEKAYSGGFGPGVPPLPIPNREVKPGRADGTAPQCGRVGRRLFSTAVFQEISCETAFFVILSGQIDIDCMVLITK